MNIKHQYKGFTIIKRGGRVHRTARAKTGYMMDNGAKTLFFSTLSEAKVYVDSVVAA